MGLNISQLSLAYSPKNDVLDGVVRGAVVNLFAHNIRDIIDMIREQDGPDLPDFPEIPPGIELNATEIVKQFVRIKAYNNSSDLIRIYNDEQSIREVIAAVEFDDQLFGLFIKLKLHKLISFINCIYFNSPKNFRCNGVTNQFVIRFTIP